MRVCTYLAGGHRIYGRRVIRMLCPPHHHDKHPEHHDEDYRRALRAELEEFETWLAELQQRKDKSEKAVLARTERELASMPGRVVRIRR